MMKLELTDQQAQVVAQGRPVEVIDPMSTGGDKFPESYVDFRRLSTVLPQWTDSAIRLASLTEDARQAMLLQLFRFLARVDLKSEVFGTAE